MLMSKVESYMVILLVWAYLAIIREDEVKVSSSLELWEEAPTRTCCSSPARPVGYRVSGRRGLSWQFQVGLDVLGFGFPHVLEMPAHQVPIGWRRLQLEVLCHVFARAGRIALGLQNAP